MVSAPFGGIAGGGQVCTVKDTANVAVCTKPFGRVRDKEKPACLGDKRALRRLETIQDSEMGWRLLNDLLIPVRMLAIRKCLFPMYPHLYPQS